MLRKFENLIYPSGPSSHPVLMMLSDWSKTNDGLSGYPGDGANFNSSLISNNEEPRGLHSHFHKITIHAPRNIGENSFPLFRNTSSAYVPTSSWTPVLLLIPSNRENNFRSFETHRSLLFIPTARCLLSFLGTAALCFRRFS